MWRRIYRYYVVGPLRYPHRYTTMDPSANMTTSNPLAGLPQMPHGVTMENTYGAMLLGTFFSLMFVVSLVLVMA